MTTIRATCPGCGDVELAPESIDLQWCSHVPASFFRFACPRCGTLVLRPADARIAQLLISAGVRPVLWHLPKELLEEHDGPPLTIDDVLDLHSALERDDWFEELRRLVDAPPAGRTA